MKQLITVVLMLTLMLTGCGVVEQPDVSDATPGTAEKKSVAAPDTENAVQTGFPLTGLEQTSAEQRPVAVMVSNAPEAVRQWGLNSASVVMEALTEGDTTNCMLWFDGLDAVPPVGPVAQGKDVFWQFALPMNSILVQKGMNTYAENLLNYYGWQPLDALMLGVNCFDYDGSDPAIPEEYNWYTQGSSLKKGTDHYQMQLEGTVPFWQKFGTPTDGAAAASVTVQFSENQATTLRWEDGAWNMYHGDGTPQLDANNDTQMRMTNVLVLCAAPSVKDNQFIREYDLTAGEGLYLVNGTWQPIHWKKGDVADRLRLFASDGSPLLVAPGKTYLAIYGGFAGQSLTVLDDVGGTIYSAEQQTPAHNK